MEIKTDKDVEIVKVNPYKAWPMLMAFIALTVWIVRLEAKVDNADNRFNGFKTTREKEIVDISSKLDGIIKSVGEVREDVAEIKGKLSAGDK